MAKQKWYHKAVPHHWVNKHLNFQSETEFLIFLGWAVFLTLFIYTIV